MYALHRDIELEDFQSPDSPPALQTNSAKARKISCRDGFNDMETVPPSKAICSKKRKKEGYIPGMGQLSLAQGAKETKGKARVRRQMPILDPDLLLSGVQYQQATGNDEVQRDSTCKTMHGNGIPTLDVAGPAVPELENGTAVDSRPPTSQSPQKASQASTDYDFARVFRRRAPQTSRQPLAFGRRLSVDLMMVKATRPDKCPDPDSDEEEEDTSQPNDSTSEASENDRWGDEERIDEEAADQEVIRESLAVLSELRDFNFQSSMEKVALRHASQPGFACSVSCPSNVTMGRTLEGLSSTAGNLNRSLSFGDTPGDGLLWVE